MTLFSRPGEVWLYASLACALASIGFCALAIARIQRTTTATVAMGDLTKDPQSIVFSSTSAWQSERGMLMLGPEYEIRVFDRRTGKEAFK